MENLHAGGGYSPGPLKKFLAGIACVDKETMRQCPAADWDSAAAVGAIMVCSFLYLAGLFFLIGQKVFSPAGEIRPEIICAALFLASFVLSIDAYSVIRAGWHSSGVNLLRRGGLDIGGGLSAQIKFAAFIAIRICLSVGLAQLMSLFLALLIFSPDIASYTNAIYLQANAHLVGGATALVDGEIHRATEAVDEESKANAALSAQLAALRQDDIDPSASNPQMQQAQAELTQRIAEQARADAAMQGAETFASNELGGIKGAPGNSGHAGDGLRHKAASEQVKNARTHAAAASTALDAARNRLDEIRQRLAGADEAIKQRAHERLPGFEATVAAESAKLSGLQERLTGLVQGRDAAIRTAIENAPDHVGAENGLIGQIAALEHVAGDSVRIKALIILIDVVSFGFELAAVLAKVTSYVPTTYAAILVRDGYLRIWQIVEEMTQELERPPQADKLPPDPLFAQSGADADPLPQPTNDNDADGLADGAPNLAGAPDDFPPPPPKRPRGRPPKAPVNGQG